MARRRRLRINRKTLVAVGGILLIVIFIVEYVAMLVSGHSYEVVVFAPMNYEYDAQAIAKEVSKTLGIKKYQVKTLNVNLSNPLFAIALYDRGDPVLALLYPLSPDLPRVVSYVFNRLAYSVPHNESWILIVSGNSLQPIRVKRNPTSFINDLEQFFQQLSSLEKAAQNMNVTVTTSSTATNATNTTR